MDKSETLSSVNHYPAFCFLGFIFTERVEQCHSNLALQLTGECNTIVSAYTTYNSISTYKSIALTQ